MGGNAAPLPFPDALGQFSVETAALGAQAGVHTGGLVNVVTQSGTNTYHGSAFEFGRRTRFDATPFFSTYAYQGLHQDQYGGTFGGHILRDKLVRFRCVSAPLLEFCSCNQHCLCSDGSQSGW